MFDDVANSGKIVGSSVRGGVWGYTGIAYWSFNSCIDGGGIFRQYRRNTSTSSTIAVMLPIADPAAIPAMAPGLKPVVAVVVDVNIELGAKSVLEAEVAVVEAGAK